MTLERPSRIDVQRARAAHVARIVDVHLAAFPGFFLSFLGPSFLRLFYAEAVAQGEICFVAMAEGAVAGFVMGSARPAGFFGKLVRRRLIAFGLAALPAVIRRPSAAKRVIRALLKPRQAARAPDVATLMSLAVAPTAQGLGAGKALALAFLDESERRGARVVDLTTDKFNNERTNQFYRALGFVVAREITTPEQRVLNEYEIRLSAPQARV